MCNMLDAAVNQATDFFRTNAEFFVRVVTLLTPKKIQNYYNYWNQELNE